MRKIIKKLITITVIWILALVNIGASYLPSSAYMDSPKVKLEVELHTIEYLNQSANTSDEELTKHHKIILGLAKERCSDKEISKLNESFDSFLKSRSESDLKVYSDKSIEFIMGKPNYILFIVIIILIIAGIFLIPFKKRT